MKTKKLVSILFFGLVMLLICYVAAATADPKPQYGGILKAATGGRSPKNLGWPAEMGPTDRSWATFYAEQLVTDDEKGNVVPVLATSWEVDPVKNTITYHLRKGVKFHDGTDFNAEAVRWNMQAILDSGKFIMGRMLKSMDVVDDHTFRLHLTQVRASSIRDFGGKQILSPTAIEANGKQWALKNAYGTGAFKIVEYKRGAHLKLEKYSDYWRPGRPYLDGIEMYVIPDSMTASASLQTGEIDIWKSPPIEEAVNLEKKGFKLESYPTCSSMSLFLASDSNNPGSIYANKKVREALICAIDTKALAKAVSPEHGVPLNQLAPPGVQYYNPNYKGRTYNPEKAKALLAEAGYPDGFSTKIFSSEVQLFRDIAAILQGFLAEVGINAKVEVVDSARYGLMGRRGWKGGLMIGRHGIEANPGGFLAAFGPEPHPIAIPSMWRSPEYNAEIDKTLIAKDYETYWEVLKKCIKIAGDDAMAVPLITSPQVHLMQNYVHDSWLSWSVWNLYEVWKEKK